MSAKRTIRHRIGGEETTGASTRTAPVWDPASGEQQAEVLLAEPADVDAAVRRRPRRLRRLVARLRSAAAAR